MVEQFIDGMASNTKREVITTPHSWTVGHFPGKRVKTSPDNLNPKLMDLRLLCVADEEVVVDFALATHYQCPVRGP